MTDLEAIEKQIDSAQISMSNKEYWRLLCDLQDLVSTKFEEMEK